MISPKKLNLRYKLFLIIIATQFIVLSIIGIIIYLQFEDFLFHQTLVRIKQNVTLAELLLEAKSISQESSSYLKGYADRIGSVLDARVTVMNPNGRVIADSEVPSDEIEKLENHIDRPEVQQSIQKEWGFSLRKSETVDRKLIYVCKSLRNINNEHAGFLRLSLHSADNDQMLKQTRLSLISGGLLVLLISGLLVIFFARKMNRNLQTITRGAKQISEGELDTNVEITSGDELEELGDVLNEMSSRLSESFRNLTRQRKDLNAVLSSINDGIIAIGPDKKAVFHNEIAVKLFNLVSKDIEGKYYYDLFLNKHLVSLIDRFFEESFVLSDEITLEDNRILEVVINPFKLMGTQKIGAVLVARDVTNYKKLERIRRDFVANVSHEFKNPLASIQGYAETLLDWAMDDPKVNRKYLQKIVKQARNLENLVTDLLQLARVEGLQSIEIQAFDPIPILKELKADFSDLTTAKKIDFKFMFDEDHQKICGDPEMFKTIMANLISNAIKYSPEAGEVIVSTQKENGFVEFSVKDTGIGIPTKYVGRIFERFFRVDKARSKEVGGTGLGLSIVKHMAELQQAKYGVESEVNVGSRFWVKFKSA